MAEVCTKRLRTGDYSSWPAIIAAISKHKALTITFLTRLSGPSSSIFSNSYNYNAQDFPTNGYTYKVSKKITTCADVLFIKNANSICFYLLSGISGWLIIVRFVVPATFWKVIVFEKKNCG